MKSILIAGNSFEFYAKRLLFPGLDLHTRSRYRFLPSFFQAGELDTLDAGCGNGALAYAAYRQGNHVLGITLDSDQVRRNRAFFAQAGTDCSRLDFQALNLYDLPKLGRQFDQIICSETLEHVRHDRQMIDHFYNLLKPQGILHLCCPYALHSEHHLGRQDGPEDGGHVRDGYTLESYKSLLRPAGFEVIKAVGIGSPWVVAPDKILRLVRHHLGEGAGVLLFPLFYWPTLLDFVNPKVPYSLYVQVRKMSK